MLWPLKWTDVNFTAAALTVQVANQKLSLKASRKAKVYTVPLTSYAVKLFKRQERETGSADFVFASFGEAGRVTDKVVTRACARPCASPTSGWPGREDAEMDAPRLSADVGELGI